MSPVTHSVFKRASFADIGLSMQEKARHSLASRCRKQALELLQRLSRAWVVYPPVTQQRLNTRCIVELSLWPDRR
jgi:hypothetical protein